jgi:hypothetical protein
MKTEANFLRNGKVIVDMTNNKTKRVFKSIAEAKRASALIQKANGGLGNGAVHVRRK